MHYLYEPFLKDIQHLIDISDPVPLVSVASGDGYLEQYMNTKELICVDPEPESYPCSDRIFVEPNYNYVTDLIADRPDIVGNCNMFICNAEPTTCPTDVPYDYDAVQLLKPRKIIAIYDHIDHYSGSKKFIEWVDTQKILYNKEFSTMNSHNRLVYI